jgi:predicted RNA-binding protein
VAQSYWLDLFTGTTWEEFLAAGGEVSGFRERRWKTVQQMKPGDHLLCYLTGISRWIGVLEVVSEPFKDTTPIWKDEAFPARVRVRPVATLSPETAAPVFELRDELTVFRDLKNPNAWTGHFRGSPARWKPADGQAVVAAILDAKANPISRPVCLGVRGRPQVEPSVDISWDLILIIRDQRQSAVLKGLRRGWRLGRPGGAGEWASYWGQEQRWVELAESPAGADDPGRRHARCGSSPGWPWPGIASRQGLS